jgi:hypothetical protein
LAYTKHLYLTVDRKLHLVIYSLRPRMMISIIVIMLFP